MQTHLLHFLEYIRLNRNLSPRTVKAYESDLSQFLAFLERRLRRPADQIQPTEMDHHAVRGFMAELYDRGHARASAARRLAASRNWVSTGSRHPKRATTPTCPSPSRRNIPSG